MLANRLQPRPALSGGTQDDYWNGSLSDVQTWTYALTPDQITALYQQIQVP